ncbi:hypothetical protein SAMN05421773_102496 [Streptomyces aidingensis]|uniref:Uncharacterized protein n=1 Tax=Streptomyces aidingensis TaxID=910347 RepID=A0A1I1HX84_9ACTN|nr:hypothetical protein SAMN05421773_102496 [Streptomyces aidingensis]
MAEEKPVRRGEPVPFRMAGPGGVVELPSTIAGIRSRLPEDERVQFDLEVRATGAGDLPAVLARWAMHIPTELDDAEEALVLRLKDGDFSGLTFSDDGDDSWRSTG